MELSRSFIRRVNLSHDFDVLLSPVTSFDIYYSTAEHSDDSGEAVAPFLSTSAFRITQIRFGFFSFLLVVYSWDHETVAKTSAAARGISESDTKMFCTYFQLKVVEKVMGEGMPLSVCLLLTHGARYFRRARRKSEEFAPHLANYKDLNHGSNNFINYRECRISF